MEDVNAQLRRLDMNHGFVRYIQRNQFDRDEYNNVMCERARERKAEVQDKIRDSQSSKSKRESPKESRVYVPPHRRSRRKSEREEKNSDRKQFSSTVVSEVEEMTMRQKARSRAKKELNNIDGLSIFGDSSSGSTPKSVKQIFTLNMKNNEGEEIEIPVLSTDKAASLAKQIGKRYNFSEEQCRNLRITLDKALEQHLDSK